jgi:uncharacterized protein YkwD
MTCTTSSTALYTTKQGDTLYLIAKQELGDEKLWHEIKKIDGTAFTDDEASNLEPGLEIYIPGETEIVTVDNDTVDEIAETRGNNFVDEVLAAHNKYRSQVGVAPLKWSNALGNSAQQWANKLAGMGKLQHSRSGENLAMGSGGYSVTGLIDLWGNEKRYFTPGNFPNVSTSGKWQDVGHYTQVVWRNTTEVGCGIARGNRGLYLVAHYNPVGNFMGQRVY